MLQSIRNNSQGTIAKVIIWVIVVTFALFGVESIVGSLGGEPEVAEVNGEPIPESTFKRAVESKKRQMLSQMGENADPDLIDDALLNTSVLDGLIRSEILYQDAEERGIYVAESMLNAAIASNEAFHIDGKFSNERLQMLLRQAGLTVKDYKQALLKDYMINQPRSAMMVSGFLLPSERDFVVRLDRQERSFGLTTVLASSYHDSISISDENVEDHYKQHKKSYVKPESVDVSYVVLQRSALAEDVVVDEAELQKMYEAEVASFEAEERRDASHILIKAGDDRSDQEALAKITEIAEKISAGEDFAELAKTESEDDGSAKEGGKLGLTGRGVYVDTFEEALFSLELGQVSPPVKTEYGYHLIRLNEIAKEEAQAFEAMRPTLEQRYLEAQADRLYREKTEKLADISYASADLVEPAEALSLKVKTLVGVSKASTDPIFSAPKVQKLLFADELVEAGENSPVIEAEPGVSVVFRVDAFHPAGLQPLVAVKEQIRKDLIASKAREFAASVGQAFYARVAAGEDPNVVARDMGLKWAVHENIRRDNFQLDQELIKRVFAMGTATESDRVGSFELPSGDFAVVKLNQVNRQEDLQITAIEKQSIESMLSRSLGAVDYASYEAVAVAAAEVEKR